MIVMEIVQSVKETAHVVHVQRILIVMEILSVRLTIHVVSIYIYIYIYLRFSLFDGLKSYILFQSERKPMHIQRGDKIMQIKM